MTDTIIKIIIAVAALAIGLVAGYLWRRKTAEAEIGSAEDQARRILEDAIRSAEAKKKETLLFATTRIET